MNNQLWDLLKKEDLVTGELPASENIESPWFFKILLAVSGWLAAIFLLCFIGFTTYSIFEEIINEVFFFLVTGFILLALAFKLFSSKNNRSEFVEHLGFAFSIAGKIALIFGLYEVLGFHSDKQGWLLVGMIELLLLFIMPNSLHRLVSAFITAISFAALIYSYHLIDTLLLYTAFLTLLIAFLWLNEFKSQRFIDLTRSAAYGFTLALIIITATKLFMYTNIWQVQRFNSENGFIKPWMGELLLSSVILYITLVLLKRNQIVAFSTSWLLAVIATILLTFLSLEAHGLIVGVMIIMLGFSASNRMLTGLGILSLLYYSSTYYYLLDNTLLDKSITLVILGMVLIMGRWIMLKLLSKPSDTLETQVNHLPTLSANVSAQHSNTTSNLSSDTISQQIPNSTNESTLEEKGEIQ